MKNKYLACQRQNVLHPVLRLECQRHCLAVTEMNIGLCFPCILLLDALWHWAVDIQKIVHLLLETREKGLTHVDVKKQNKTKKWNYISSLQWLYIQKQCCVFSPGQARERVLIAALIHYQRLDFLELGLNLLSHINHWFNWLWKYVATWYNITVEIIFYEKLTITILLNHYM